MEVIENMEWIWGRTGSMCTELVKVVLVLRRSEGTYCGRHAQFYIENSRREHSYVTTEYNENMIVCSTRIGWITAHPPCMYAHKNLYYYLDEAPFSAVSGEMYNTIISGVIVRSIMSIAKIQLIHYRTEVLSLFLFFFQWMAKKCYVNTWRKFESFFALVPLDHPSNHPPLTGWGWERLTHR